MHIISCKWKMGCAPVLRYIGDFADIDELRESLAASEDFEIECLDRHSGVTFHRIEP